jgi:general secretion pathway protein H
MTAGARTIRGQDPRSAARGGTLRGNGFTLIEIMIVMIVIAFVAAAATPALRSVTGANARQAAGELAGTMRYLFDTAAMRHQTCRLAIDIEERSWWAECTKGKAIAGEESDSGDDDDLSSRFPDERQSEARKLLAKAKFGAFNDRLAKKRQLPGTVGFTDVWTQHQREPLSKGMAYIYFYPQGQAEAAQVPMEDGGNVYTVTLQPFTGRARVVSGKPEVPR